MSHLPEKNELPLPDYDHIPLGTLPSRIHGLDARGVSQLLDFERNHGNRLPVIQVLEQRLEALQAGEEPSGPAQPDTPEVTGEQGGSPVDPSTSGPTPVPPFHGNPTYNSQPGR
ncbi:hypothetical protein NCCP1664_15680 [Zafaria cholistanensis]|uniref:DUF8129 domain-containing protein n=1 Tax=Zafaria cholistanensis TaxID=1682741 RepID=A0A5A7NSF1_9MICC|nr:hypothetical protein [Zafaria cholistanensis]GER23072.1 hypothetical protein NCCP1664_15680 [Zafaria cholistanensis]